MYIYVLALSWVSFLNMASSTPHVWLKEGHSLRGKDVLLVVMRLLDLGPEPPLEDDLASISRKYPLASYSTEDLESETKKLTGYDLTVGVSICFFSFL
jgi:hypothetical protein